MLISNFEEKSGNPDAALPEGFKIFRAKLDSASDDELATRETLAPT